MLHPRRRRGSDAIPTSSLADIAFLLLVFFLVTTVFDEEKGLSLVLPGADTPAEVSPNNLLQLRVLPDGIVEVRRGRAAHVQRVGSGQVAALWRGEASSNPSLIAAVLTDPDAPYFRMVDVLDALRAAGAERISLQMADAR